MQRSRAEEEEGWAELWNGQSKFIFRNIRQRVERIRTGRAWLRIPMHWN